MNNKKSIRYRYLSDKYVSENVVHKPDIAKTKTLIFLDTVCK